MANICRRRGPITGTVNARVRRDRERTSAAAAPYHSGVACGPETAPTTRPESMLTPEEINRYVHSRCDQARTGTPRYR